MASRSLGTLTLDLVAKIGGFTGPIEQAGRSTKKWQKDTEKHARAVGIAIGAGVAAAAGSLLALTTSTVRAAEEISRFASVSNTSTTEFQKLAAGADVVGISQEKLSDIFKDVNDKVGDFLNTGGGELKDFFDKIAPKVGVTADQFRNLSGPDALGLYVSSLEKAGASHADMTFYLEAIANDATLLLPLLKNNAEGFKSFGAAALAAGSILDEKTIKSARELSAANWLIKQSVDGVKTQIATALLPTLASFATQLNITTANGVLSKKVADDLADSFKGLAKFALGTVAGIHLLGNGLKTLSDLDNASMGEGSYWERWVPPARIYRAFQSIDAMKATLSDAGVEMDKTAQGYADLLASFDKPGGGQTSNQVKELADLLDRLRQPQAGTLTVIPPDQLAAAKKAAQEAEAAAKRVNEAFSGSETDLMRQIALINTSVDAQKKATEIDKLRFEIASGKLVGINKEQQKRLETLAAELDVLEKLKIANEEEAKSAAYAANLKAANSTIKAGFESDIAGAGLGDKARDRLRQDLAIRQDYNQQMADLQKQLNSGDISQELYSTETGMLKDALDERLGLQQDYYSQLDDAQNDWLDGVSSTWENYRDMATDYQQQAADASYDILNGLTGSISDNLSAMVLEGQTLGDSFRNIATTMATSMVNALTQMAAQWLVYQGVQLLVGRSTETASVASAALAGPAIASAYAPAAAMVSLASFGANAGPASAGITATTSLAEGLAGMAHDGIDSVPADGSWYLQKGERVTTAETSAKLDNTLERVRRDMNGSGGATGSTTHHYEINLPNATDARSGREAGAAAARKITRAVKAASRYS